MMVFLLPAWFLWILSPRPEFDEFFRVYLIAFIAGLMLGYFSNGTLESASRLDSPGQEKRPRRISDLRSFLWN